MPEINDSSYLKNAESALFDLTMELPDDQAINYYRNEFLKWVMNDRSNRVRMQRNFGLYSGVDNSQWPTDAIWNHADEGRPISSFNYIQKNVDTVLGSVLQNPFKTVFVPEGPDASVDDTRLLQQLFEYDFNRGNYEWEKTKFYRDGLIFNGVLEMFVDYRHDTLGNIGLAHRNPAHIFMDPYWQTDDIRDCRYIFKATWMTAREVKDTFKVDVAFIENQIKINETNGFNYFTDPGLWAKYFDRSTEFYDQLNQRFRILEVVWMQRTIKKRVKDTENQNLFLDVEDPEGLNDAGRLQGNGMFLVPEETSLCKVFTFAPAVGLNVVLVKGNHPVQVGRLPYFIWSEKNLFGERQGLVDILADAQLTLNKRESMATFWQITQANGSEFIERDLFDDEGEYNRYLQAKHTPGNSFTVTPGAIKEQKQAPISRGQMPIDLLNSADRALTYMNNASSLVEAVRGQVNNQNQSGSAFTKQIEQALVPFRVLQLSLKSMEREIAEAYFFLSKKVYSDAPRVFHNPATGDFIPINQFMKNGVPQLNNIANIPRHNIRIEMDPMGFSQKEKSRNEYFELSKATQNPILRAAYELKMVEYMDLPKHEKEEIIEDAKLFVEMQKLQVQNQMAQNQAAMAQLQAPQAPPAMSAEAMPGQQVPPQPAPSQREIANFPGMGNLAKGIAGGQTGANNLAPSDMVTNPTGT